MLQSSESESDKLALAGDFRGARKILAYLAEIGALNFSGWLKLSSMCIACGEPKSALESIHKALELKPLDFTALLARASCLQRLNRSEEADEAYERAIAQKPLSELPPQLVQIVEHAEARVSEHLAKKDALLETLLEPVLKVASKEEAQRIKRFRSNALRITKPWHSEPTHFHYPGLTEQEFHDRLHFPWIKQLESATDIINSECMDVIKAKHAELVPYIQYSQHEPLEQWRSLNHSPNWTAVHLLKNGMEIKANTRHCPATMELLNQLPQPDIAGCSANAMFSLLAPGAKIPPHHGITNTRLVCHLPLVVPHGCWFRVGAQTQQWERGVAWIFDDTIEHEAENPSTDLRIVFIFDIWHHGLSTIEQRAVRNMIAAEAGNVSLSL